MHQWNDENLTIKSYESSSDGKGTIQMNSGTAMILNPQDSYYLQNVKSVMSKPGDWYLDREEQMLYYVPDKGDAMDQVRIAAGQLKIMMTVSGVRDIIFNGIEFCETDWHYLQFQK